MKAVAFFPGSREVKIIDCAVPELAAPKDVKVRVVECGVCGTDRSIVEGRHGSPPPGSDYLIIGHECVGEVVEVGAEVSNFKPGDLVVPLVRLPCPHEYCTACREGRPDFCYSGDFTERGIKGLHGFMTEYAVVDEDTLFPINADLKDVAVLVEPLTIAEKAITQVWQVQQRLPWSCHVDPGQEGAACHRAVIVGAGSVGLLGALMFAVEGFSTCVYSREPANGLRSRIVEAFGGKYICSETNSPEDLAREVGNIDLIYEATGAAGLPFELMAHLGANGVFVFTGVPDTSNLVEIDTRRIVGNLVRKNQVIFGTVNAGRSSYQHTIENLNMLMIRWPDAVRSIITGRHKIEDSLELLTGPTEGIKNTIAFK